MLARSRIRSLVLAVASSAVLAAAPNAQCTSPDGLTGPCWQPTVANLPSFPGFFLPTAGLCWVNCNPLPKESATVQMTPPVQLRCAEFGSQVTVTDAGGTVVLSGFATLNYTRTWEEFDPLVAQNWQVWRMLLKIDFSEGFGAPPVCFNPSCLNVAGDTSFWYGYVDWALNCATGVMDNAFAMYHACDAFVHNPFLSSDPAPAAGYHPASYFALVGPDTPANPFVPGVIPPRGGTLFSEAVRNVASINPPNLCVMEERIQGSHFPIGQACLCPIDPTVVGQSANRFTGLGTCPDATGVPSSFLSLNLFNPTLDFNWFEMIATSLGRWSTAATYPGPEGVLVDEGFFLYHDSCAATFGLAPDTLDFMYGAKTTDGFPAIDLFGNSLPQNFIDLASNYSLPFVSLPLMGSVKQSDHLIYANF